MSISYDPELHNSEKISSVKEELNILDKKITRSNTSEVSFLTKKLLYNFIIIIEKLNKEIEDLKLKVDLLKNIDDGK